MNKDERNKKDKDIDDKTKKYVSDDYADANPDTTTSKLIKNEQIRHFVRLLDKQGGYIVCADDAGEFGIPFEAFGRQLAYIKPGAIASEAEFKKEFVDTGKVSPELEG